MISTIQTTILFAATALLYVSCRMIFEKRANAVDLKSPETAQISPHSDEVKKNVSWEPDDYSDLSDGKFERLSRIHTKVEDYERWDELDGREHLTDNQFQHIKKGR